jgi:hypothetical protein
VPDDIIVRGVAVCPECIEQGKVVFPEPEAIEEVARLREALTVAEDYIEVLEHAQDGYYRADASYEAKAWEQVRAALSGERKGE